MDGTTERIATAHHESGHAVVACILGHPFEVVSLLEDPSDDRAGGVRPRPLPHALGEPFLRVAAIRRLRVVYAGCLPEARYLDVDFTRVWSSKYSWSDREVAGQLGCLLSASLGGSPLTHQRAALRTAQDLVDAHCASIAAVALELAERDELSPDRVAEIVAATGGSPRFPWLTT